MCSGIAPRPASNSHDGKANAKRNIPTNGRRSPPHSLTNILTPHHGNAFPGNELLGSPEGHGRDRHDVATAAVASPSPGTAPPVLPEEEGLPQRQVRHDVQHPRRIRGGMQLERRYPEDYIFAHISSDAMCAIYYIYNMKGCILYYSKQRRTPRLGTLPPFVVAESSPRCPLRSRRVPPQEREKKTHPPCTIPSIARRHSP